MIVSIRNPQQCILVGEDNPHGADPAMALYPLPLNASGARLVKILDVTRSQYLTSFVRVNLCARTWVTAEAAKAAQAMLVEARGQGSSAGAPGRVVIVALGTKVGIAFRRSLHGPETEGPQQPVPFFTVTRLLSRAGRLAHVLYLPHPSGRNHVWNVPGNQDRAVALLRELAPWVYAQGGS